MGKLIRIIALSMILLFAGCVSDTNLPSLSTNQQYQEDSQWCANFGTFGHTQELRNRTYKECMERFGYKF